MDIAASGRDTGGQECRIAELDARRAAARAQVEIVTPDDEASAVLISEAGNRIWGPRGTFKPNELRALMHAGAPVHLALDVAREGRSVVGFAVGFLGWSPVLHVHSHQVGVIEGHRRRGIGLALKMAQRQTCLDKGITDMRWTFDPLVRRNVSFNLGALGARAAAFYVDFYGIMNDSINGGDASDRLEAVWTLDQSIFLRTSGGGAGEDERLEGPLLLEECDGRPVLTGTEPCPGGVMAVPADYDTLRRQDRSLSLAWRQASREVLRSTYDKGLRIGRVSKAGYQMIPSEGA